MVLSFITSTPALADNQAGSDYARVVPVTKTEQTVTGQQIVYPAGNPNITSVVVTLQPGEETGRHLHSVPTFGYILDGELAISYEGSPEKTFKAGDGFVEALHTWHNGRAVGEKPVRILAVFIGSDAAPAVTRP
ncbi:cupin domain-containing protein [Nitratireductor pacificus]|uniref:Cupin n=1 Tax=Nitratireductor pacificus pht-3B TaxID=391937 RepID=K2MIJ3_9HYPH|nr:cupin domain-containing protein [Nitratireductor pacificus]EKF16987.1 cupin [Nitratireductor pacificus pht-3B]